MRVLRGCTGSFGMGWTRVFLGGCFGVFDQDLGVAPPDVVYKVQGFGGRVLLPLASREWKNGSSSSCNCTPFLHSLLTKGKF